MKNLFKAVLIVLLLGFLFSCAYTTPLTATSNDVGIKQGESKLVTIFGIPLPGDAGIWQACRNGGIKKISTVDVRYEWWLIGFNVVTVVNGE